MRLIFPTGRGWCVFAAGLIWLAVALVHHTLFPFLLACGGVALTGASLLSALLSLRGISVCRGAIGEGATGEAVSMPLIVVNTLGRRRQPIAVLESVPFSPERVHSTVVASLGAQERRVVKRRVLAMQRGEFGLDRLTLRGGDPAGLFYCQRHVSCPQRVLIVPGTEPLPDLQLQCEHAILTTAGAPVSATGTSQEFYGVREYHPTDGLRYIHWKSSARSGRLMVREFERNAVMSVAVLLDAYRPFVSGSGHWSNLEYQVRAAASICDHLSGLYCSVAFAAGGSRCVLMPTRPAADAKQDILYALATLQPGDVPLAHVAFELGSHLPRNSVVYCLSLATPRSLSEALEVLRQDGMTVRWFCAHRGAFGKPSSAEKRVAKSPPATGVLLEAGQMSPGMDLGRALALR